MKVAHILQSGFLAWPTTDLVKIDAEDTSFKNSLYTPDYQVIDTENYYDKGVEALFSQWRKDNSLITHFEFREAVILSALRVFRDKSIVPWIRLQLSQSSLSYLHRKFLSEVFRSAIDNTAKTMENMQYYQLLRPTLSAPTTPIDERDVTGILSSILKGNTSDLVADILVRWTEDLDGVLDLLSTLHVIFGRRSGAANVATK